MKIMGIPSRLGILIFSPLSPAPWDGMGWTGEVSSFGFSLHNSTAVVSVMRQLVCTIYDGHAFRGRINDLIVGSFVCRV